MSLPIRVGRAAVGHLGIGVHHDNIVALCPLIETRVRCIGIADQLQVLLAAVEGDMQPAGRLCK